MISRNAQRFGQQLRVKIAQFKDDKVSSIAPHQSMERGLGACALLSMDKQNTPKSDQLYSNRIRFFITISPTSTPPKTISNSPEIRLM